MRLLGNARSLPSELRVLDLCTGTGCIPLLFHHELYATRDDVDLRVIGVDISDKALQLAVHNLKQVRREKSWVAKGAIGFMKADVLANPFNETRSALRHVTTAFRHARLPGLWDIVISNPPYISPKAYWETTTRSVRNFEPKLALVPPSQSFNDDVQQGDTFYMPILRLANDVDSKIVLLEIADLDQALRIAHAARKMNIFDGIEIWREQPDEPPHDSPTVEGFSVFGQGNARSVVCWRGAGTTWLAKENLPKAASSSASRRQAPSAAENSSVGADFKHYIYIWKKLDLQRRRSGPPLSTAVAEQDAVQWDEDLHARLLIARSRHQQKARFQDLLARATACIRAAATSITVPKLLESYSPQERSLRLSEERRDDTIFYLHCRGLSIGYLKALFGRGRKDIVRRAIRKRMPMMPWRLKEELRLLEKEFRQLDKEVHHIQRDTIFLQHYLRGETPDEIGKVTGLEPGTVTDYISRLRRRSFGYLPDRLFLG